MDLFEKTPTPDEVAANRRVLYIVLTILAAVFLGWLLRF